MEQVQLFLGVTVAVPKGDVPMDGSVELGDEEDVGLDGVGTMEEVYLGDVDTDQEESDSEPQIGPDTAVPVSKASPLVPGTTGQVSKTDGKVWKVSRTGIEDIELAKSERSKCKCGFGCGGEIPKHAVRFKIFWKVGKPSEFVHADCLTVENLRAMNGVARSVEFLTNHLDKPDCLMREKCQALLDALLISLSGEGGTSASSMAGSG